MPKIKYIEKKFRENSLNLITRVNNVIEEYKKQGYSLTLRQVYYQMVARDIIDNNERSYKNLGSLINDARLSGLIDWEAIEDRTRNLRRRSKWENPSEVINSAAGSYHIDYWEGQENYIEVWVEKDALVGIVGRICEKLDVNYFSCRGYVSQSEMWVASQRLKRRENEGKNIILLHLGDHDPSGIDMSRDIIDRQILFGSLDINFDRLALNMNQIDQYNPPPNPTKITDSRASSYINKFGYSCWELDALEPQVISELIEVNIKRFRDNDVYNLVKEREEEEIEELVNISENYNLISKNMDEIERLFGH